jgi:hypothetical protein
MLIEYLLHFSKPDLVGWLVWAGPRTKNQIDLVREDDLRESLLQRFRILRLKWKQWKDNDGAGQYQESEPHLILLAMN